MCNWPRSAERPSLPDLSGSAVEHEHDVDAHLRDRDGVGDGSHHGTFGLWVKVFLPLLFVLQDLSTKEFLRGYMPLRADTLGQG